MHRTVVLFVALFGCASTLEDHGRRAIVVEHSAHGGQKAVDVAANAVKDKCRAKNLPTPQERQECVGKALTAVEATEQILEAIELGLEAFWRAYAIADAHGRGATEEQRAAVADALRRVQALLIQIQPHLRSIQP